MFKMLAKTVYRAKCVWNVSNAVNWRLTEKKKYKKSKKVVQKTPL